MGKKVVYTAPKAAPVAVGFEDCFLVGTYNQDNNQVPVDDGEEDF